MAYNTPIVCKEVYLPLDGDWLSRKLTSEPLFSDFAKDYLKEYGIDLNELFSLYVSEEDGLANVVLKPRTKFYGVLLNPADKLEVVRECTINLSYGDANSDDKFILYLSVDIGYITTGFKFLFTWGNSKISDLRVSFFN